MFLGSNSYAQIIQVPEEYPSIQSGIDTASNTVQQSHMVKFSELESSENARLKVTTSDGYSITADSIYSFHSPSLLNMRGWHAFGQTWIVWTDTDPSPETYRIYKASSPIYEISSAKQIGRIFQQEWAGERLRKLDSSLNWTIPDGSVGTYTLKNNEALFVYTPHNAATEYFALVKDSDTIVEVHNTIGPISQTTEPVQCHLQRSGTEDGFTYRVYAHWIDGQDDWNTCRSDYPVMGNEHFCSPA